MYKLTCKNCNKSFKDTSPGKKFCSIECRHEGQAKRHQHKTCMNCGNEFRYHPSTDYDCCSHKCKGELMVKNSTELNLSSRADYMRQFRTEDSIKKGVETRTKNGHIIDWDKAEWKQYWKRCDWLTRKIRQQMLNEWDGIDYIDGEYIKDNLSLHFTHGDYPTLDHLKSRSQCFKENISPYDATNSENLKWTKRRNNSSKNKNSI